MTKMNLTGLAEAAKVAKGKPLSVLIGDILPDPNNPRDEAEENTPEAIREQEELDANVKKRGIKTPLSIRSHPTIPGKYVINHGHRRFKSATRASFPVVPAFVDEDYDSYDQVNENEHRRNLTARSLAMFIKRKLGEGQTKGQIAEGLSRKNQNFITEHLALIDAPDCVDQAYAKGVRSARTLYDLRRVYEEFPEQVGAWCDEGHEITRGAIAALTERLRHGVKSEDLASAGNPQPSSEPAGLRHDVEPEPAASAASGASKAPPKPQEAPRERVVTFVAGKAAPQPKAEPKPAKPAVLIMVEHKGRKATVQQSSVVSILYEGDADPVEIPLSEVVFVKTLEV